MKILRREDYRQVPWRNGMGQTEEVALQADMGAPGQFDWRISMAPVMKDGAFSLFPDVDRILTVIEGEGLRLTWPQDGGDAQLCRPADPAAFPGDRACHAELLDGPILDLNVMTRRGRWRAEVRSLRRFQPCPGTAHHLIFAMGGPVDGSADGKAFTLAEKDTLWMTAPYPEALSLTGRWLDIQLSEVRTKT